MNWEIGHKDIEFKAIPDDINKYPPNFTEEQAKNQGYPCITNGSRYAASFWAMFEEEDEHYINFYILSDFPYHKEQNGDNVVEDKHAIEWEIDSDGSLELIFGLSYDASKEEILKIIKEYGLTLNEPFCIDGKMWYSGDAWEGYDKGFDWTIIETNRT